MPMDVKILEIMSPVVIRERCRKRAVYTNTQNTCEIIDIILFQRFSWLTLSQREQKKTTKNNRWQCEAGTISTGTNTT